MLYFIGGMIFAMGITVFAQSSTFRDQGGFAGWYKDAVLRMKSAGVINGYPDGNFNAGSTVNRAELATTLDRYNSRTEELIKKILFNK